MLNRYKILNVYIWFHRATNRYADMNEYVNPCRLDSFLLQPFFFLLFSIQTDYNHNTWDEDIKIWDAGKMLNMKNISFEWNEKNVLIHIGIKCIWIFLWDDIFNPLDAIKVCSSNNSIVFQMVDFMIRW